MEFSHSEYVPAFKALSDETRLKIIDMLSCGELCACEILEYFSISQSTLSYHMKILVDSELVNGVRDGAWMRYTINNEKTGSVINFLTQIVNEKEDCICKSNSNKSCNSNKC
ncbi:MAG TPA: metalloregulator ArsR/SmtB family transcription factor [Desulfitobacteriaceae bacterium]|nr:metalloregulator ArsR/SmtB family transcription factor [Desulfitobacteriaceae bacterium]